MWLPTDLKDYLETTARALHLETHPYFSNLLNGSMSKRAFVESQKHFAYAVKHYSRNMASLAGRIPDPIIRGTIVANLWDEHGEGDPSKTHFKTILALIEQLDGDPKALKENDAIPAIDIFNSSLEGIALHQDYRLCASVFAAIERVFVDISSLICKAIVSRGWVPEVEQVAHYSTHNEVDIRHAEEFLSVVADSWDDPEGQALTRRGIRLGIKLLVDLYMGLERHCQEWQGREMAAA